ncbi:MAG: hypothetical protein R2788_00850 [Saprospiraceae bacterium]
MIDISVGGGGIGLSGAQLLCISIKKKNKKKRYRVEIIFFFGDKRSLFNPEQKGNRIKEGSDLINKGIRFRK